MKLKPLLLICLLVLEAFMPCSSTAACASHTQEEEIVCPHHASDSNETDHSEEEKHCSDGCRCYCCSVVLIPRLPSLTTSNQAPAHPLVVSRAFHYHFDFTYSIWQPPKPESC